GGKESANHREDARGSREGRQFGRLTQPGEIMGWEAWTTVGVVLPVLGLLAFTRAAPDVIFIGAVTHLITFGVLTPEQAASGLSNEGVITVGRIEGYTAPRHERALVAVLRRPTDLP
ncbi:MAG: hypothetical protein V1790_11205, partial [Planctomycetota bacterium]